MLKTAHVVPDAAPEGKRGDLIDWRQKAVCRNFPFKEHDEDPWYPVSVASEEQSWGLQICAGCPVLDACWADALENEARTQVHGIRAGRTSEQRKTVYRRRQRDAVKAKAEAAVEQAA